MVRNYEKLLLEKVNVKNKISKLENKLAKENRLLNLIEDELKSIKKYIKGE